MERGEIQFILLIHSQMLYFSQMNNYLDSATVDFTSILVKGISKPKVSQFIMKKSRL